MTPFEQQQAKKILSCYSNVAECIPAPIQKSEETKEVKTEDGDGAKKKEEESAEKKEEGEQITKADFSDKERKKLSEEDEAEADGSFPIRNTSDLSNAIKAYGRSKDKDKTKAWIKKRAKELGAESSLPEDWK